MPKTRSILIALTFVCALVLIAPTVRVDSQADSVRWSQPVKLSTDTGETFYPTVVTDLEGGVYVFWAQGALNARYADTIFYTHWTGQSWSTPIDLFAAAEGESFNYPHGFVDNNGRLHLVWSSSSGVYYSSVAVADSSDIRAWSEAQLLVDASAVGPVRLAGDRSGDLYVVYMQRVPGTNVMLLRSTDGAASWSDPLPISTLVPGDPAIPDNVRLKLDSADRLHVVWSENYPPDFISRHVYHARSDDRGDTWSAPTDLADPTRETDWDASIDLAIDASDRLHVTWTCGVSPGRCYRSSTDGGVTWTGIQRLFDGLIGLAGWDALLTDPYNEVFWLGTLRYPQAFYFSSFANNRWIEPPQVVIGVQDSEGLAQAHFPQAALGRGNQVHVVLIEGDRGPVWYLTGTTSRPPILATPPPTLALTPTPAPSSMTPLPVATLTRTADLPQEVNLVDPGARSVLFALIPVVIVIGAVFVARHMRQR